MTTQMKTVRADNAARIESLTQAVTDGHDDSETVLAAGSAKVASGEAKKPWPSPPSPPAT